MEKDKTLTQTQLLNAILKNQKSNIGKVYYMSKTLPCFAINITKVSVDKEGDLILETGNLRRKK